MFVALKWIGHFLEQVRAVLARQGRETAGVSNAFGKYRGEVRERGDDVRLHLARVRDPTRLGEK